MTRVLITGASTGIGKDLAYEFGKHNHSLLLVARSEDKLIELKDDLTTSSSKIMAVVQSKSKSKN